jgi:MFS transporter, CP family, cyanate transporter
MEIEKAPPRSFKFSYSILAFLLLAANLRPALTGVGPVLQEIRSSLALPGAAAGLLAALPLLMFGGCSPFARLATVFGLERTLAGCLALTTAGIAVRSLGSVAALFAGTMIFATGIAVANVLMPSLIKRDFPYQIESMTTAYLMVMSLTAAAATGVAAPLADHLAGGWRSSLAVWAVFAALALLCWLPKVRNGEVVAMEKRPGDPAKPVWRSALAWQITFFMGLQSLIYYVTLAWMPVYLAEHGVSRSESGLLLTLSQGVAFAVGFVAPALLRRGPDQRPLAVAASLITALCVLGLAVAPRLAGLWLTVFGASLGITFILAFALIGLRTNDHRRAASLSAMAQAAGYLIAATGPIAFGLLHDLTAGWTVPMAGLVAVTVIEAGVALGAGRRGSV